MLSVHYSSLSRLTMGRSNRGLLCVLLPSRTLISTARLPLTRHLNPHLTHPLAYPLVTTRATGMRRPGIQSGHTLFDAQTFPLSAVLPATQHTHSSCTPTPTCLRLLFLPPTVSSWRSRPSPRTWTSKGPHTHMTQCVCFWHNV
jgi:hypothetical protein